MTYKNQIICSLLVSASIFFSHSAFTQEITSASTTINGTSLSVTWTTANQNWHAEVEQDMYLGETIPFLSIEVTTGDETEIALLPNCYYRGVLTDENGLVILDTVVYVEICNTGIPFRGFVSEATNMHHIMPDSSSITGISMQLEVTGNEINAGDDSNGNKGWGAGGSGGALTPSYLYARNMSPNKLPSLDIYIDPTFVTQVGETEYIARVFENLTVANTMYAQSDLNQIHLAAILLLDRELSPSGSQGNLLHRLEKIRKYTVQNDSADTSIVLVGGDFNYQDLWGWAELGFACDLQHAVTRGKKINTHNIGKAVAAIIDLPTLLQRGWILAHEVAHTIGSTHNFEDPLTNGFFQPELALKDYVSGCTARSNIYQACSDGTANDTSIQFYDCN